MGHMFMAGGLPVLLIPTKAFPVQSLTGVIGVKGATLYRDIIMLVEEEDKSNFYK